MAAGVLVSAATFAVHAQQLPGALGTTSGSIEILPVHGSVYMLAGPAGNSVVQTGPQGVIVVDTMRTEDADALVSAVRQVAGGRSIRYVFNTSGRANHVGGNVAVAAMGQVVAGGAPLAAVAPNVVQIVAHENVLKALSAPSGVQAAMPLAAWPTDTFFDAVKKMYVNGEGIQLVHQQAATTDGDLFVYFRGSDVIAAGDVLDMVQYPIIDRKMGGHVNGIIDSLNKILDLTIAEAYTEGGTRVVPGRGRLCDQFEVLEYRDMITIIRDRVLAMIKKKMTLDQIKATRPTLDWEPRFGSTTGDWTTSMFLDAVYANLKQ